ncbi:hypothetical protein SARC_09460 [Sphaeroforma arctica JP610]|uniref:Metaxin glutathione S-transferase domain-containing protein n=1 Tax=Sphaeroforma arctica JP610 TaxID=667725 RepID=A0A0L0FMW8_9EUKA|nr:hypothetical protein SARC_09460 [Sphaeroforma arctica JP610]KNC78092.1 hypothetical protein SARC_09460 [Sphaeroforma arctica JP610]|eukprot:XP_014151994.1 hypothetical protein SARC_09460 [Sphaeroforma arctica JP610]
MSPTNALPFIRQDYDTLYAGDDILQFAVDNVGWILVFVACVLVVLLGPVEMAIPTLCHATRDIAVLTEEQQIDCRAILALIEDSVIPAIYHMLWCDQENFSEATLPAYEKAYTWPLSLYIPHKMRTRMITNIHDVTGGASAEEIVTAATDACGTIADYLEDQRYLFGDKPHALDAVVYGHLSFILNCPMRNEALKLGVLSRSALTRYLRASLVSR